jgi:glycerol-3-phosphate dehydrogenase
LKDLNPLALELRSARLKKIVNKKFDLLVIGAGVHGALVSWIASQIGLSVLVIDSADYGQGTSSRSSKLLHGGVRYLEQGHLALVYKSLKERREFMRMASHLTRTLPFLYAIKAGVTAPSWLVQIGLGLYQSAARLSGDAALGDLKEFSKNLKKLGLAATKLVPYQDAQINDVRFCIEAICEANKHGAESFNYLSFRKAKNENGQWQIELEDKITSEKINVTSNKIVNLAGAAVKQVHQDCFTDWPEHWPKITYSTGVHLFFDLELDPGGLILPAESKGRYYFVLPVYSPYRRGIYIGTTDRQTEDANCYPSPSAEETEQLISLIKRDLPNLDLTKLYHKISGTRVLAGDGKKSSEISREEQILESKDYVTMLGGKYTTARSSAYLLLEKLFNKKIPKLNLVLTGSKESLDFTPSADLLGVELQAALNRFGANAKTVLKNYKTLNEVIDWQIKYCIENEQALYWEDLFSRRLNLDFLAPEHELHAAYKQAKSRFY